MERKRFALASACLVALLGCRGVEPIGERAPSPEAEVAAAAAPSFELGEALERARSAFFVDGARLVAGAATHRVEIAVGDDALAFTPVHSPAEAAAQRALRTLAPAPSGTLATRVEASAPFVARTESITRGETSMPIAARTSEAAHGVVEITRGQVVETIASSRRGVEQSWRFASAPAGDGDLIVRVRPSGMGHVATTASGEHFRDEASGLGVVYGHGTWVDADGARTPVPVRFESGLLVLRVPADAVLRSAYPAVLDPLIGPEVGTDTPVVGPRGAGQLQPSVASDGTSGYLVVFTDTLLGDQDVRFVRVSSAGALLDPSSTSLGAMRAGNQSAAQVVWAGTQYFVAWEDDSSGDLDVYATTVSAAGTAADRAGTAVASTTGVAEHEVAIAAAGTTLLVTWTSGDAASSDVVGARYTANGNRLDAAPVSIGGGAGQQGGAAVAATGTSFLVVYEDAPTTANTFVRGRRIDASGTVVDASPFLLATGAFQPTAGWAGGATYLVAYTARVSGRFAVSGVSVPVSGAVGAVTATVLTPSVAGRDYADASLAWNGSSYLVTYIDGVYDMTAGFTTLDIGARVLSATGTPGTVVDPTSVMPSVLQARVTTLGATFFVVFTDSSGESADIRATRIEGTTVSNPAGILVSSGPNDQTAPVVATNGSEFLVAWTDFRSGNVDAWGATFDASGAVVGASLLAGGPGAQFPTAAAWSGSRYVVLYNASAHDVRGVTVTAAGIPSAPFDVSVDATLTSEAAAVACAPTIQCLAVWQRYDAAAATLDADLYASRIDASTASVTVSPAVAVVTGTGNQFDPAIASSTARFYVAWTDARVDTNVDVRGTRFLVSALEAGGTVVGGAAGAQYGASVASDGTDFVVAFTDQRVGGTFPNDIYAQRIAGATGATMGANVAVAASAEEEGYPAIAFAGRYLVAYQHANATDSSVEAVRLDTSATVVDTTPLAISASADSAAVAGASGGRWLTAYRVGAMGSVRVGTRLVTDDQPNGASCTDAAACTSGFCVDGVCCATECAGGTTDCNACSVAAGGSADGTCSAITTCTNDAGTIGEDAGTVSDAGSTGTDGGGTGSDGGIPMADGGEVTPPSGSTGGCGCTVPARGGSGVGASVLVLMVLAALARRRAR
ncbi:MAG: hypothetical protein U0234_07905 [Sandaracinus sp.]